MRNVHSKGLIFVISAPSGCGKTSLVRALLRKKLDLIHPASFTTRSPRQGERDRKDYHFVSEMEFKRRLKRGDFLEWSKPFGQFYATPKEPIVKNISQGRNVVLSLDVKGACFVKKKFQDAILIYILPPSLEALEQRLINRSTDHLSEISKRLSFAAQDISNLNKYDYAVVNDDFSKTVGKLQAILIAERLRVR
ncbi:MAG: guanylate kinase [Candidatus Omnitrophota bacterium]